jgi:DNA-binding NarL/FixJ family response regulator
MVLFGVFLNEFLIRTSSMIKSFLKLKKRVVIIEDEEDLRITYKALIENSQSYSVINCYANCEDAIAHLKKDKPEIVLMDIELPGMDGVQGTTIIKERIPNCEIIMLTVYEDSELVFKALKAGAGGYLTKSAGYADLIKGLDEIVKGGAPMSSRIARMVIDNFHVNPNSPLSVRETQIVKLLAEGKTFSQISEELFIARETVKSHLRNIYTKLRVSKKSEALAKVQKEKYI